MILSFLLGKVHVTAEGKRGMGIEYPGHNRGLGYKQMERGILTSYGFYVIYSILFQIFFTYKNHFNI